MAQEHFFDMTSLLVPSVRDLIKEKMDTVPERYIFADQEEPVLINPVVDVKLPEIPVINMQKLLSEETVDSELTKLHLACKEWGFFQLVDHGVSKSLVEKMKIDVREFFDLPMEEKKAFCQTAGEFEGFGQVFVVSEEQKLDWSDLFLLTTLPVYHRNPRLIPKLPFPFRDTLEEYSKAMKDLAMAILAKLAKALNMDPREMDEIFEEGIQAMRMNLYPPCPEPEKVVGRRPHSDATGLTILLQASDVDGFELRKNEMWIPVKPLPDAFIVNVGDILEMVTNGIYKSILHRAVVNSTKERLTIATFLNCRYDGVIAPAPSLISEETPAQYKRIRMDEFLRGLFARQLNGKSYVDTMKISANDN